MPDNAYIGIDLGTSGVRCCAINDFRQIIAEQKVSMPAPENPAPGCYEQDANIWWQATVKCLQALTPELSQYIIQSLAVDGTSSTLLLVDENNKAVSQGLMYNDGRSAKQLERILPVAPPDSSTLNASSSLAKLLYLLDSSDQKCAYALHQADWIAAKLCGTSGFSDENNCLKLGYDPVNRCWPDWLSGLGPEVASLLPEVFPSATTVGRLAESICDLTGLPSTTKVVTGTTDSTASTLAAGIQQIGDAVTTIGTTMVIKVVTDKPVFSAKYGVYSHRISDDLWLAGGASNCGGKVLLQHFDQDQLVRLSGQMSPMTSTGLNYYPLPDKGERFPINDPDMMPSMSPRPDSDVEFLQGLFEGLANVEKLAYERLAELGAPQPQRLFTAGGASINQALTAIRQKTMGLPIKKATNTEASYGSALIAFRAG